MINFVITSQKGSGIERVIGLHFQARAHASPGMSGVGTVGVRQRVRGGDARVDDEPSTTPKKQVVRNNKKNSKKAQKGTRSCRTGDGRGAREFLGYIGELFTAIGAFFDDDDDDESMSRTAAFVIYAQHCLRVSTNARFVNFLSASTRSRTISSQFRDQVLGCEV